MESTSSPLFDITMSEYFSLTVISDKFPPGQCRYIFTSRRTAKKAGNYICDYLGIPRVYRVQRLKKVSLLKRR